MNKYKINKSSIVLMIIITIICTLFLTICLFYSNLSEEQVEKLGYIDTIYINVLKDLLIVVISIVGTNLLVNTLIEVKSKNQFISEFMANDIISSPDFYTNMKIPLQIQMCTALENTLYYKYKATQDMGKNIQNKITTIKDYYYFEECTYMVTCNVHDNYIEEDIIKEMCIKSYAENASLTNFPFIVCAFKTITGIIPFELSSIRINGELIKIKDDVKELESQINNFNLQNDYDYNKNYVYKRKLNISCNSGTKISIKYKTRSALNDRFSIFKSEKPCKKFSLTYSMTNNINYRLVHYCINF